MSNARVIRHCLSLVPILVGTALAHADVEPNGSKATAQQVNFTLGGASMLIAGTTSSSDDDFYSVNNVDFGQNEVTLTLDNTSGPALTIDLVGLQQVNGTITTNDAVLQSKSVAPGGQAVLRWYTTWDPGPSFVITGVVYVRVRGTGSSPSTYSSTLSSSVLPAPIVAAPGSGFFAPGPITITATNASVDTDLWVYNCDFGAIAGRGNDDAFVLNGRAQISANYVNSRYIIAITNGNLANSEASPASDLQRSVPVADFRGVFVADDPSAASDLSLTINDGSGPVAVSVTKPGPHGIAFVQFQVGPPAVGGSAGAFCAGDGLDPTVTTPCPCGNFGAPGAGCANSFGAGATLAYAAGSPSTLTAAGMPQLATCVFFQGDGCFDGVFGDGIRCAGGNIIRLGIASALGGAAVYPGPSNATIEIRGQVGPGSGRRYYQTFYRNAAAAFCPPFTFNATNGWIVDY